MTELTDADIDAAMAAGQRAKREELRATTVRYDRKTKRIIVDLNNGSSFAFPPQLAPELAHATEDQLAEVDILGSGYGLHWESLRSEEHTSELQSH